MPPQPIKMRGKGREKEMHRKGEGKEKDRIRERRGKMKWINERRKRLNKSRGE